MHLLFRQQIESWKLGPLELRNIIGPCDLDLRQAVERRYVPSELLACGIWRGVYSDITSTKTKPLVSPAGCAESVERIVRQPRWQGQGVYSYVAVGSRTSMVHQSARWVQPSHLREEDKNNDRGTQTDRKWCN